MRVKGVKHQALAYTHHALPMVFGSTGRGMQRATERCLEHMDAQGNQHFGASFDSRKLDQQL
jgi:hypothetical protein